jgi:hypothetical protein
MDRNSLILKLSLLQKVQKIILPLRHKDTKVHKDLISNNLYFIQLSALVPLWQKTLQRILKFETVIIFAYMKISFKILFCCLGLLLFIHAGSVNGQILKDTVTLELVKKGIDCIYNFQFSEARKVYNEINRTYPDHPVVILYKGMLIYWENYPMLPTSPDGPAYEESLRRCIDQCEKRSNHIDEAEILITNLCARGLLLLFYTDNNMSLEVFPLATTTYPLIRRAFGFTNSYPDFYFYTGLYNYYREAYPDNHPAYKPLAALFPKGDRTKGIKEIQLAASKSIVLKAEAFSFLSSIYLGYEKNFQRAFNYSKSLNQLYPSNLQYLGGYLKNLLLVKKYDEAEKLITSSVKVTNNSYLLAQTDVFNGILQEKKYNDKKKAEYYYNKGIRALSLFGDYGNEFEAYAYFGLSRISDDSGEKHYKRTYRKLALKLAVYKKIDFDD